ncbi:hypothetical protein B0H34DRAFT_802878 [Crassisporium funariophilum]|nr:hypothetical protein B0H34DRAFT_802878 [Crassisporium funariophilum]
MRSSPPLLSRPTAAAATPPSHPHASQSQAGPAPIPSIRLISATPSATGLSSEASTSFSRTLEESWASASLPSPLAPKSSAADTRKRLVPKKSKLSILSMGRDKTADRSKDLSDVVRRVGGGSTAARGFEIYVDPMVDPDIGEIVMVKKKKSRAALDGMAWGALGEVTNVPSLPKGEKKEAPGLLKVKEGEKEKWWSIGRGRKDSKEKTKESKMSSKPVEFIYEPTPRSKTPEPFKSQETRGRFNSLDSGILLNPARQQQPSSIRAQQAPNKSPSPAASAHNPSSTPTAGGLLAPAPSGNAQGSIALRAIRSVRSLARMGSWAQLKNMEEEVEREEVGTVREKKKSTKEKKEGGKDKENKEKKKDKSSKAKDGEETGEKKKKSLKSKTKKDKDTKDKKEKEKAQTIRMSSSSFEVGALNHTASPLPASKTHTLGSRKHSILGMGLPSSMRLPGMRSGSTASSLGPTSMMGSATTATSMAPAVAPATVHRLSVDSALMLGRPASVLSSGSSLRPLSTTSTNSRNSRASSGSGVSVASGGSAVSVRWDEEGLDTIKEQRKTERQKLHKRRAEAEAASGAGETKEGGKEGKTEKSERRSSKESRRSSEGRWRTPLSAVFPGLQHGGQGAAEASEQGVEGSFEGGSEEGHGEEEEEEEERRYVGYPILTIEEATSDGHGRPDSEEEYDGSEDSMVVDEVEQEERGEEKKVEMEKTPVKKARARPLSEQLLGRSRPRPMYEDEEGVISILDAATNDLALLINNLDLQATPGTTPNTPDMTPLRPSPFPSPSPLSFPTSNLSSLPALPVPAQMEYTGSPTSKSSRNTMKRGLVPESPLRRGLRESAGSVSSLRPYAQSRGNAATVKPLVVSKQNAALIAQQIAPWPTLVNGLSPLKEKLTSTSRSSPVAPPPTFRPGHKRTMTPAPEPEPELVFQPLRPAKSRAAHATLKVATASPQLQFGFGAANDSDSLEVARAPSSLTFGSRSSSRGGSRGSMDEFAGSLTPVFKRISDSERKRSSLVPADYRGSRGSRSSRGSQASYGSPNDEFSLPIAREARRVLGMSGTMGGSDVSCYQEPEADSSDPDSDVPDELRFILATHSERGSVASLSFQEVRDALPAQRSVSPESPVDSDQSHIGSAPPMLDLPVFHASLIDDEDNMCSLDEGTNTSDEDTKKSFDFTGELQKLNESGGSDRRSFVEQLENAFRTPAKVDLRYDFGGCLRVDVPPVPKIPVEFGAAVEEGSSGSSGFESFSGEQLVDVNQPSMFERSKSQSRMEQVQVSECKSDFELHSASRIVDVQEPTMEEDSLMDSIASDEISFEICTRANLRPSPSAVSAGSHHSDGQLNTSFRFGGLPRTESSKSLPKEEKELTLSDIIPSPSHARSLSQSSSMDEDDSVLKSIYAKIMADGRPRVDSDSSARDAAQAKRRSIYKAMSRPTSGVSFAGFESFDEVRRGFEFSDERPAFYPPPATRRAPHRRHESVFSIASVSSYGHVINNGSVDPFDYGLPSLMERPSSEDLTSVSMSMSVDDTFAFLANQPRRRVESDASSFYFRAPQQSAFTRGHRRRESNMSVSSQAPPISLYNRSFGVNAHRRNDSSASASSVAQSYARYGANSGMAAWTRHRKDLSTDSVMSDFSAMHLGRPGLGDKMFDNPADHGPLTSISASPPESAVRPRFNNDTRNSYDSICDEEQRESMMEDSLFEKTGRASSGSEDSVFGDDYSHEYRGGLLPPNQFRPLSVLSMNSVHSPSREDDTMISMLGGGHVRRRSVGSIIEASPCVRVEKRKHSAVQGMKMYKGYDNPYESPNKARIVEKPSIASTSSYQFGGERMIKAQHGLLERQSLEDSCLIADGEELSSAYCAVPVFSRPVPSTRSRSSTCTSSSGGDTPPLSASDGSHSDGGSQSSIDLSQINLVLSNATHPMSTVARQRVRARARGTGHRRRYSKAHMSRSSVYETIEEEISNASSPARSILSKKSSPTTRQPIFVVDSDTASINSQTEETIWDDERGIITLRKFYALRDEAVNTVVESKRTWLDTPFSLFALQSFQAPENPAGMQALLEHSVQNYGPLPSDLRPRRIRSRTSSRPSPYPQARVSKMTISPDQTRPSNAELHRSFATPVLQQIPINTNRMTTAPSLEALKPFSPLVMDVEPKRENAFGLAPAARPRVGSTARRTALGWSKRSTGAKASTGQKENAVAQGTLMTPGETLRLNRPRARGRPTPASQNRPIRI